MDPEDKKIQERMIVARSRLWTPELDKLLRKWKKQIALREKGHINESRKYSRRHYIFGIPAAVIGAIAGTGMLSTFRNCDDCDNLSSPKCQADIWVRLIMGLITIFSAALIAFQTFMNYQAESKDHKDAADGYGALHREIDSILLIPGPYRGDPTTVLQGFRRAFDNLIKNSPSIPKKYDDDLTYKVKRWDIIRRTAKPPRPEDIKGTFSSKERLAPLQKLLKKTTPTETEDTFEESSKPMNRKERINQTLLNIRESLKEENKHDTSDDEVCIGFDLDEVPYYNPSAWASSPRMTAMQQAMNFEMKRLDRHAGYDVEAPPPERKSRTKKRGRPKEIVIGQRK